MASRNSLQAMPNEIKAMIFKNVDINSVPALARTCRSFHKVYHQNSGLITHAIAVNTLGGVLPFAIAHYAAVRADWKACWPLPPEDELVENIHQFGRKYLDRTKAELAIHPKEFTFDMVAEMVAFHSVIEKWALVYTVEYIPDMFDVSWTTPITTTEMDRVKIGMYTIEISRTLLPFIIDDDDLIEKPWEMLWHYFPPWENRIAWDIDNFFTAVVGTYYSEAYPEEEIDSEFTWLSNWGIRGLDRLDDMDFLESSLDDLEAASVEKIFQNARFCRRDYPASTWLKPVGQDMTKRSLDIKHILARFPQDDTAACQMWYFELCKDVGLFKGRGHGPSDSSKWFDLARVHAVHPGVVPSLEEMQAAAEGKEYVSEYYTLSTEPDYCREIGYY
ncbi:hypothetical protein F5Y05DRAFT_421923 [Hypoxylon sp. FL0543]|nr:hypothetical protein F5Y05DRAFT_421923 [Hypoxylon sp. FL0543]